MKSFTIILSFLFVQFNINKTQKWLNPAPSSNFHEVNLQNQLLHKQKPTKVGLKKPPIIYTTILQKSDSIDKLLDKNQAKFQSKEWQFLRILVLKTQSLTQLPPSLFKSLVKAIMNISLLINVRAFKIHKKSKLNISSTIQKCVKDDGLKPQLFSSGKIVVERFTSRHLLVKKSLYDANLLPDLLQLGNFFLILQADQNLCSSDKYLLADAAPCVDKSEQDSPQRPIIGRLNICYKSKKWKKFRSEFDLFRHEILHALGFGLYIPLSSNKRIKSKFYDWKLSGGKKSIEIETHFMDFAEKATEYAKKYFQCSTVDGIEAEDANKIHLSEYIFGNELMTPSVNNGPNYFTFFSALILESTFHSTEPWYSTNHQIVAFETQQYWWGRGAGCGFLKSSCFELIQSLQLQNPILIESEQHLSEWSALAFCGEPELIGQISKHLPKKICFQNKTKIVEFETHCQVGTRLHMRPVFYEPITLQSQFPALSKDEDGWRPPSLYGSDNDYRYCPMLKEMIDGTISNVPWNAKMVTCPTVHS